MKLIVCRCFFVTWGSFPAAWLARLTDLHIIALLSLWGYFLISDHLVMDEQVNRRRRRFKWKVGLRWLLQKWHEMRDPKGKNNRNPNKKGHKQHAEGDADTLEANRGKEKQKTRLHMIGLQTTAGAFQKHSGWGELARLSLIFSCPTSCSVQL